MGCEFWQHAAAVMLQQLVLHDAQSARSAARSGVVLCTAAAGTVLLQQMMLLACAAYSGGKTWRANSAHGAPQVAATEQVLHQNHDTT